MDLLIKADKKDRGQLRGGTYLKRVVTGTDKDGSPQYRYLRTKEEVEAYEASDSAKTHEEQLDDDSSLKEKREKEEKESKKKETKKPSLFVDSKKKKKKNKDDDKKVKKSSLFLEMCK